MIAPGQYIPECLPNRCNVDGLVTFRNNCHFLNQKGPCELSELAYVVAVNTTTLELECIKQNPDIVTRFQDDDDDGTTCFLGSKRAIQGKC